MKEFAPIPENLQIALSAIPNPKAGEIISLSLSMVLRHTFPYYDETREYLVTPESVIAIVASSTYPSLEELIANELRRAEISERDAVQAKDWITTLWENRRIIQPRLQGFIPEYPRGGWRWTGKATEIPFRRFDH